MANSILIVEISPLPSLTGSFGFTSHKGLYTNTFSCTGAAPRICFTRS
jgi:hypothetical protein